MSEQCKNCGGAILSGVNGYAGKVCNCDFNNRNPIPTPYTDNSAVIATMQAEITRLKDANNDLVEALERLAPIFHYLGWIAICWNDHNFDTKAVYTKVNEAFTEAGFNRRDGVNPINDFVEKLEALAKAKGME